MFYRASSIYEALCKNWILPRLYHIIINKASSKYTLGNLTISAESKVFQMPCGHSSDSYKKIVNIWGDMSLSRVGQKLVSPCYLTISANGHEYRTHRGIFF